MGSPRQRRDQHTGSTENADHVFTRPDGQPWRRPAHTAAIVSKRLGHSTYTVTADTYCHLLPRVGRAA
ncbi:hypothetical protein [Actinophytocola sp.]|uniref:hypothetical protein n=1 Tax=Actinophytocola sp. TaxID=1872138 RepID=UPI002ED64318